MPFKRRKQNIEGVERPAYISPVEIIRGLTVEQVTKEWKKHVYSSPIDAAKYLAAEQKGTEEGEGNLPVAHPDFKAESVSPSFKRSAIHWYLLSYSEVDSVRDLAVYFSTTEEIIREIKEGFLGFVQNPNYTSEFLDHMRQFPLSIDTGFENPLRFYYP